MVIYSAAVILSACLLFLVQPLIAKIILPWFGGTSAVWSAALVFFQVCVLAGYTYAHVLTTYVRPHLQAIIHATLLLAGCALLPIIPSESWRPAMGDDPTLQILLLLSATVGLPAFLLSATSPLLQVWYMRAVGSDAPYWLFALSNGGSMLALLSFPLLLEPLFGVRVLAVGWSALFVVFAVLCGCVAWASRTGAQPHEPPVAIAHDSPSVAQMASWVLFAACGSAMLVSISAHLSTNVAPIPLLWVVPLVLYLLTFILCFSTRRFYNRAAFFPWLAAAIGCVAYLYTHSTSNLHIQYVIPSYLLSLFAICMACHGELVSRRPAPRYLTRFYLLISLGGALGGAFVALLAPLVFETYLELPLVLIVTAALGVAAQWRRRGSARTLLPVRIAMAGGVVALAGYLVLTEIAIRDAHILVRRNFYGVLSVRDEFRHTELARRNLLHGTISHGYQFLNDAHRDTPSSYFSPASGVGRALQAMKAQGPIHYGVIGLGVGVLSSYARAGDTLRIYEINPAVVSIANELFTFLPRAKQQGARVELALGDARLTLEREPPQNFDLLIVDAFSSDAIPTHLLTNEAIALYFEHLQPKGVLAIHISNRYLDLTSVCFRAAKAANRTATVLRNPRDVMSNASVWVLMSSDTRLLNEPQFIGADMQSAIADGAFHSWTDQYSSLWAVFDWRK